MRTDALSELLRDEMQSIDQNLPLNRMRTMAQVVRDAEWVGRMSRNLSHVLTFIAVMLAALGLYAVTSYAVSQQTHEIGLRMALGAGRWQVVWFIARRVALQLAIGLGTGVVCTKIWGSIFSTGRAGVTFADIEALARRRRDSDRHRHRRLLRPGAPGDAAGSGGGNQKRLGATDSSWITRERRHNALD